jgi:hypothetical protein
MGSQDNPTSKVIIEPKLLREMEEHMVKLRKNLKIAWDRQKHYAKKKQDIQRIQSGRSYVFKSKGKKEFAKISTNSLFVVCCVFVFAL